MVQVGRGKVQSMRSSISPKSISGLDEGDAVPLTEEGEGECDRGVIWRAGSDRLPVSDDRDGGLSSGGVPLT